MGNIMCRDEDDNGEASIIAESIKRRGILGCGQSPLDADELRAGRLYTAQERQ